MPACYSPFSSPRQRRLKSVSRELEDVLNISPRLSHHNPKIHLERRFPDRNFSCSGEMVLGCSSTHSISLPEASTPKDTAQLVKEIAALEMEVINLERYLLSLYRAAFDQYLTRDGSTISYGIRSYLECHEGSLCRSSQCHGEQRRTCEVNSCHWLQTTNHSRSSKEIEKNRVIDSTSYDLSATSDITNCYYPRKNNKTRKKTMSGHRSLADHLGVDHVTDIPCRLSEDIVKCITAIYCKLADPPIQQTELLISTSPSLSTSSSFNPQDPSDNGSPQRSCKATNLSLLPFDFLKDKRRTYTTTVEILKITVDGNRFDYAFKMLSIFSSFIRQLETVNPRKMRHKEQLAFWINIHNALVMHAFLAYGLHQNQMKSMFTTLKAAYDVGGHSINACDIQSSILRCRPHSPAWWLSALYLPAKKFIKARDKHPYALDHPEPLARFALSSGAYSDPAVRVYTSKGVHHELKLAKEEFIQANVHFKKENKKVILPKILYYYAKDASLELYELLKVVCECVPETQQKAIQGFPKERLERSVEWSPHKSAFRYLVHRDLATQ